MGRTLLERSEAADSTTAEAAEAPLTALAAYTLCGPWCAMRMQGRRPAGSCVPVGWPGMVRLAVPPAAALAPWSVPRIRLHRAAEGLVAEAVTFLLASAKWSFHEIRVFIARFLIWGKPVNLVSITRGRE